MATSRPRAEVELEIKQTLGQVPTFFSKIPDDLLDYEWTFFRRFELEEPNQTNPGSGPVLSAKVRQLMGIAVHAETKCEYCIFFHTELAKLFGATDAEVQEAVHYAKHTLGWSGYLNGIQEDLENFKQEVGEIGGFLSQKAA